MEISCSRFHGGNLVASILYLLGTENVQNSVHEM